MRSQHSFSQVPSVSLPRSSFNLSHPHKVTFDADDLVPIMKPIDVIPGDTFKVRSDFFMRLATPLHPILDNLYFESFFFFVPYRLVWSNFEKFHGAQDAPGDSTDFTIPIMSGTAASMITGTTSDYFGLPIGRNPTDYNISALPFRALALIWNDWFRDENLQDPYTVATGNGPDAFSAAADSCNYTLPVRGKRHDYFTSCLPWPQKGTAVELPLGDKAYIAYDGLDNTDINIFTAHDGLYSELDIPSTVLQPSNLKGAFGNNTLYADLSSATSSTINDLRLAYMTQKILENDARTGTRFVEKLLGTWGVRSPDARLQRPEFLGGGSNRVNVTPVAQTSGQPTPAVDDKLGNLAGFGTVAGSHGFTQSFVEHGVIIALGNIRADITYSQGLDRYWSKQTAYDFYYPMLANIGEQAVLNQEIYADASTPTPDTDVFGYQERYAEYRFMNGSLTGLFRPDAASNLTPWILTENFTARPALGDSFIRNNASTPLDNAIAIPSEPHIIADFFHNIKAARPLPMFGVPGGMGRI